MLDMKKNKFKNNKLLKILAWTGFGVVVAGTIAGTTVGIVNITKDSSINEGTSFDDSIETVINIAVDQNKTEQENLAIVEDVSNRIITQVKNLGVSQVEIKSSIQNLPVNVSSGSTDNTYVEYVQYGAIHIFTEQNIPQYVIDFDSKNYVDNAMAKLSLFNALSNNYNYNLEAFNTNSGEVINESGRPESSKVNKNFNEIYQINSSDNVAFRNDSSINIPLSKKNNKDWNLDVFQQQFTDVYNWDGNGSRSDAMNGTNNEDEANTKSIETLANESDQNQNSDNSDSNDTESYIKTPPELTYLFWENRTGLINKLQLLATVGYLNSNSDVLFESSDKNNSEYKNDPYNFQASTIKNLYDQFGGNSDGDEKYFMDYVVSKSSSYGSIMYQLYEANQYSYGINDKNDDPLLTLLSDFFNSSSYKNSSVTFDSDPETYDFLYSWNAEKISLFNSYLVPIDYNNFFNYFTDNTDSEDTNEIKTTYKSQNFNIANSESSNADINYLIDLINNASYHNPILLTQLFLPTLNLDISPKEIYNDLIQFFNSIVHQYPKYFSNSVTNISPFNAILIGISVLILLIGIIVSILYRFPGVLAFLTCAFSLGLSFIMMMSLNSLFSISSYLALIISTISAFIPFINCQFTLRNSIRYNRNNLYNAFLNSIRTFIKTSIVTYVPMLIISLTFLFFGKYQINEFGSSLIILVFANLISSCILFLILYSLTYLLIYKKNPRFILTKPYISILNKLKFRGIKLSINSTNSKLDLIVNKIFKINKRKFIILISILGSLLLLGIIGCILFATIKPSYTGNAYDSTQIVIYFDNNQLSNVDNLIDGIANSFNLNWESKNLIWNVCQNGEGNYISQYTLIANKSFNINDINNWIINNKDFNSLISNISFQTLNNTIPTILFDNAIKCMFIAIGFIAIFSLIYVNFLNFIPIMLITIISNIASIGFIALLRIPVDINTILVILALFVISNIIIFNSYNNILSKFNKKLEHNNYGIFKFCLSQYKIAFKLEIYILGMSLIYGLLLMLFTPTQFIFNQLILFINTFIITIISSLSSFILCTLMLIVREMYIKKVRKNKRNHVNKVVYDKIDEQLIVGINSH